MKLPILNELPTSREMIEVFGGYNHNLRISEGEFYDMKNLTSSDYPTLSPRPKRGVHTTLNAPQGMIEKDSLCYVDGTDFVMNGYRVNMGLTTEADGKAKTLISMGAYVIIMPDKKYINTTNLSDFGSIEASVTTSSEVTFELCKSDGNLYTGIEASAVEPTTPDNGNLWLDTSSIPHTLKQYSTTSAMWISIATTYIKITATGLGKPFAVGDGITISGITNKKLTDLNNTMVIQAKDNDSIVVIGILDELTKQTEPIKVERKMPNMDFIVESENRLWGCRYGVALNGKVVNEIYASKLGDFKNWNVFHTPSISTDSYVASVGTDGYFTGAVTHLGYPIFFKENCMHKVYGNFPANYQIQTTTCRGVQKGCSKSLAIVNEILYYKSRSAICAYDGSLPQEISSALGDEAYGNAVAGSIGNKYYISMSDAKGVYHLFVCDTKRGLWHKEDNTQVKDFCASRGELYYIDTDNKIKTILGSGTVEESEIVWMAETGVIGASSPDKKYLSRIDVRMLLNVGTRVYFYVEYDSTGKWEHLFTMTGMTLQSFTVPVRPRRCDHLRLRIEGDGEAKIFSICKTTEQGSEI
ncbi:MAG: hypothetical protein U0M06_09660 [Clostridia bacterium]|nr:hypothetical protein [Clostridia bacterium]